ncbi:MAG TPA: ABC transporter ATP-binding protein [Candidatus Paceibacterota bacterium]|nr:ABC transporter ATP-binding protein [Verrucomicrobiota bacterium]HSA10803.1 ABC transporter ATP-binding protein [Candidatus Paceibacterota bacterium]
MAQVVLEHLTKVFKGPAGERVRAVDNTCLSVEDKELLVLVGPSGCGKTTTLRLIAGLEEPTAGAISIGGQVVNRLPPKDRDVAMVFQNSALYPHMSVYDNMAFGLKLRRCPRAEIDQRVRDAAQTLNLTACLDRRPATLSGGQRQRVALGRALVRRPSLLLLDEPLSNLDAPTRLQMRAEITRLQRRLGATMLYVTHDQIEALTLGQRVAVMKDGVIQQVAAPLALYEQPANLFVAGFIGSPPMNFFDGTLREEGTAIMFQEAARGHAAAARPIALPLDTALAPRLREYLGKPIVLGIRPERIHCGSLPPNTPPERTCQAVVELVQPMGAETYLHLAGHTRPIVARVPPAHLAHPNETIRLVFDSRHVHLFDGTLRDGGSAIV